MNDVLKEFTPITKVPRPSFHEEKIRDYLVNWAKEHNIYCKHDNFKNVYMRKPATSGYEDYSSIALQAHTDMVAQKASDVEFDFEKDSIEFFIDGDIVSTRGKTTLGADDGIGVASILAIFADDTLKHPMLEAIFTSCEEEDFSGAENFDINMVESDYLINLDHCNDNEVVCASAGGITVDAYKNLSFENIEENYESYLVDISGFRGGHSGEDIHRGRGNTNMLLFRFLDSLDNVDFYLNDINGGSFRLAIPRESSVKISVNKNDTEVLKDKALEFELLMKNEFSNDRDNISIIVEKIESIKKGINKNIFENIKEYVLVSPTDVQIMSNNFEGLVDCSCNLGEIFIKDEILTIITDIRSSYDSQRDFIVSKILKISKSYGFDNKVYGPYHNWSFKKESKLRELVMEIYRKNKGEEPVAKALHAGLEAGFFAHKKENMDIVSLGSNAWDYHSPKESFSISSLEYFYDNLKEILENAKF